jgi:hypothetical protein
LPGSSKPALEAIRALFRVVNRYVGNPPPMTGVFPDHPAPVVRDAGAAKRQLSAEKCGASKRFLKAGLLASGGTFAGRHDDHAY